MDAAMAAENLNYRIDFMPGAPSWVAPPGGERYNREASERHWECVHALFNNL